MQSRPGRSWGGSSTPARACWMQAGHGAAVLSERERVTDEVRLTGLRVTFGHLCISDRLSQFFTCLQKQDATFRHAILLEAGNTASR